LGPVPIDNPQAALPPHLLKKVKAVGYDPEADTSLTGAITFYNFSFFLGCCSSFSRLLDVGCVPPLETVPGQFGNRGLVVDRVLHTQFLCTARVGYERLPQRSVAYNFLHPIVKTESTL
jgi:hypothetical protein